MNKEIDIL